MIQCDICSSSGRNFLVDFLSTKRPAYIVNFAGFDFPKKPEAPAYSTPFIEDYELVNKSWMINSLLPYSLYQCLDMSNLRNFNIVSLSSIYAVKPPPHDLYSDDSSIYKPIAYGMCKASLERLSIEASIYFSQRQGRSNILRLGGVDMGVESSFKERYCKKSPGKSMVSISSVINALSYLLFESPVEITGSVLAVDSAFNHA